MLKSRSLAALAVLAVAAINSFAQPQAGFQGRWITDSGNLEVEIAPCADAWCGTVTRVLGNKSMSAPGQTMDAADKRSALGMKILTGLKPSSDNATLRGEIYNRENAKTYSVRLALDGDQLVVRPYVFIPLFGKTQVWHRPAQPAPSKALPPGGPASEPSRTASTKKSA
ncbi:DUF2147 domain-containing protein [Roseateles depolymerans]|uniref:Uncharacterized protein n=1 Tax=Roseateles depolymerans TaxID=76731 RepID=A0A0U3MJR1_9BURK|nr:DUF2147 domain-containing protein [Roseateles depolymerans]ALV08697.1 hypothetical protein RD2015_4251 [Roseateles depolymerans]REG21076.1 uncharacterized protein (DUF2147 family) [Roseateles depolymerans]